MMKIFGLILLVTLSVIAPTKTDDCWTLAGDREQAAENMDYLNNEIAHDELVVSWDVADGRGVGDPTYDYDVRQCVQDGGFYDYWANQYDTVSAAMRAANCY